MRLLLTNDDGINSPGILKLAEKLCTEHEVYIIAPDRERSAAGHSLTLHKPLRVDEVDVGLKVAKAWETTGTPGDCVKIGISSILENSMKPDLIISGINLGPNLGADILYSGTVSAALEGSVLGFPSIALSLYGNTKFDPSGFIYPAEFMLKFMNNISKIRFPKKTILNINFPAVAPEEITGIQITKLGTRMYTDGYEKRVDPRGKTYYWLAGELISSEDEEEGTDIMAIKNNKITITPVTFEITHKSIMPELEQAFCDGFCDTW